MARDNYRKVKLLKLLELLRQHTDEQHPLTTNQTCAALEEMGIPCDRRTLAQDIAVLNELGYEIMVTTVGHENAYYVEDRSFSLPELKILMDAVHASSFITEKKSTELIEKLADLAGSHRAEVLKRNMVCFNTRKHRNERSCTPSTGWKRPSCPKRRSFSSISTWTSRASGSTAGAATTMW